MKGVSRWITERFGSVSLFLWQYWWLIVVVPMGLAIALIWVDINNALWVWSGTFAAAFLLGLILLRLAWRDLAFQKENPRNGLWYKMRRAVSLGDARGETLRFGQVTLGLLVSGITIVQAEYDHLNGLFWQKLWVSSLVLMGMGFSLVSLLRLTLRREFDEDVAKMAAEEQRIAAEVTAEAERRDEAVVAESERRDEAVVAESERRDEEAIVESDRRDVADVAESDRRDVQQAEAEEAAHEQGVSDQKDVQSTLQDVHDAAHEHGRLQGIGQEHEANEINAAIHADSEKAKEDGP